MLENASIKATETHICINNINNFALWNESTWWTGELDATVKIQIKKNWNWTEHLPGWIQTQNTLLRLKLRLINKHHPSRKWFIWLSAKIISFLYISIFQRVVIITIMIIIISSHWSRFWFGYSDALVINIVAVVSSRSGRTSITMRNKDNKILLLLQLSVFSLSHINILIRNYEGHCNYWSQLWTHEVQIKIKDHLKRYKK